jgi:hypothetical protein
VTTSGDDDDPSLRSMLKLIPLWFWLAILSPVIVGALMGLGVLK